MCLSTSGVGCLNRLVALARATATTTATTTTPATTAVGSGGTFPYFTSIVRIEDEVFSWLAGG